MWDWLADALTAIVTRMLPRPLITWHIFAARTGETIPTNSPTTAYWILATSGPSRLAESGETLSSYLTAHPELIGKPISERFEDEGAQQGNLPYLFKVLSIEKCLSIQAHPSKEQAKALHAQRSDKYPGRLVLVAVPHNQLKKLHKDPNHKPEMALAITPFQALCGFRPIPEIIANINRTPELKEFIPTPILDNLSSPTDPKQALRDVFSAAIDPPVDQLKIQLEELLERYQKRNLAKDENLEIVVLCSGSSAQSRRKKKMEKKKSQGASAIFFFKLSRRLGWRFENKIIIYIFQYIPFIVV